MTRGTSNRSGGEDPTDRQIRRTWRLLLGSFTALAAVVAIRAAIGAAGPVDAVALGLVGLAGYAAILHRNAYRALEIGRRAEVESFARILRGLSRSVSPDAIVDAIVEDLANGTDADHIVVVRRRPGAAALEATLVSRRPGVRSSTTLFPPSDLDDPGAEEPAPARPATAVPIMAGDRISAADPGVDRRPGEAGRGGPGGWARRGGSGGSAGAAVRGAIESLLGLATIAAPSVGAGRPGLLHAAAVEPEAQDRIAERIAARVRTAYGLKHTLAAPLRSDREVIGALVISRRTAVPWPAAARRILAAAADEASAALARAFSHRDAETRASTDALTGLPNRRYFDEFCGLLARRRRAEDAVGVLMIDIDRFKSLNDTHGHATGDEVLRAVGGAIAGAVREDDVPARYGGEEFAVLLRNPTPTMAVEVGERVREAVGRLDLRRFAVAGVTVSVGVAVAGTPDQPISELIEDADRALYEAKRAGRDRVVSSGHDSRTAASRGVRRGDVGGVAARR